MKKNNCDKFLIDLKTINSICKIKGHGQQQQSKFQKKDDYLYRFSSEEQLPVFVVSAVGPASFDESWCRKGRSIEFVHL